VRNGAFTQAPATEGLAHLYEHMFFKANAALPDAEAFADRAGELGAVYNGTTQEERVNYYLTLPADSVAGGLRFLADALISPLFLEGELKAERTRRSPGSGGSRRPRGCCTPGSSAGRTPSATGR
jgi:zinc protease